MPGEDMARALDERPPAPSHGRWKPSRFCVLVVITLVSTVILYRYFFISPLPPTASSPSPTPARHVDIIEINDHYNITMSSYVDVIQPTERGGTKEEFSIKDLLDASTSGPVRIVRSGGQRRIKRLSHYPGPGTSTLTRLDEIKPSTLNIFFIETRCGTSQQLKQYSVNSGVVLNARQVCSIESTARLNPSRPVYLLHSCPLDDNFLLKSPKYVQELLTYPNVHVVWLDMAEFFTGTDVEELFFGGRFDKSKHPVEHVSDVVRLLALWKYGGTYMDIDVVSIRSLDALGTNYAGWQDDYTIASGVLNFAPSGVGHQILTECLEELRCNFRPHEWSTNGPILLTKILLRICGIDQAQRSGGTSSEFTAYPIPVFYPIYYTNWRLFFDSNHVKNVLNRLNDTYVVHIWNKMSSQEALEVGSQKAYGILADKYCPKAYWNCGRLF